MGRPLIPPDLLMRSTAICVATSAVLPPAAAAPDSGCMVPTLYGLACPNAPRHGAGTSVVAPSAPAAAAERPRNRRRVVLPLHHMCFAQASSCQRSVIDDSSWRHWLSRVQRAGRRESCCYVHETVCHCNGTLAPGRAPGASLGHENRCVAARARARSRRVPGRRSRAGVAHILGTDRSYVDHH